jgi:predicted AlkP superfamily pyrophosphatase or phosphodiesterase
MPDTRHRRTTVGVAAFVIAAATTLVSTPEDPHVLVISIDGLMASSYERSSHTEIPTLRRLMEEGAYAKGVVGVLPSVTYPSHTTLITGVPPAIHGIVDNHVFDPDGRLGGAAYWYGRAIKVPTLLAAVRAAGGRTAAISWPVTMGLDIDYHVPEFWREGSGASAADKAWLARTVSTPHLVEAVEGASGRPLGWLQSDRDRLDVAAFIVKTYAPRLTLVHFTELDTAQHAFGPGSSEAARALARVDEYIGELVDTARRAGAGAHTDVVVVSDHGFLPIAHQLNPNALFRREGLISVDANGRTTAWRAAFHASGGSGFVYLRDADDQEVRRQVAALLAGLAADPANGIDAVWTAEQIAQMGGPPDAAFGLNMQPGFYGGNGNTALVTSPLRDPDGGMRGGHGFAPTRRELQSALIVAGPSVPVHGSLGTVRMTQIAPTLARWLGVSVSPRADVPIDALVGTVAVP